MPDNDPPIAPQRTLLVVDDQQSVLVTVEFLLGAFGYRVLKAESGRAALALAEREMIDGAVIDVHMPVMNGFETCARLHDAMAVSGREVRIWLMTGAHSGESFEKKRVAVGACGVFTKPFEPAEFCAQLARGFAAPLSLQGGACHRPAEAKPHE